MGLEELGLPIRGGGPSARLVDGPGLIAFLERTGIPEEHSWIGGIRKCDEVTVVIAYEIGYATCWYETPPFCSNGGTPCCSELCERGPYTPCYSGC